MSSDQGGTDGKPRVPGRYQLFADREKLVHWRLIAMNGRSIAVAPAGFHHADLALRAFLRVRANPTLLPVTVQHGLGGAGWIWLASFPGGGGPAATSGRYYERNATCWKAYRSFLRIVVSSIPMDNDLL